MEEDNREFNKRLELLEQELSELRKRVDTLESQEIVNSTPAEEKQPKKKAFPRIIAALLVLCLIGGGVFAYLSKREPPSVEPAIGDIITFGKYEQNNSAADGPEPIEWLVLDKQDGKILLLSKYILFRGTCSGKESGINALIKSLTSSFLAEAFLPEEQAVICETTLESEVQITARVFLLSEKEAEKYFPSVESRKCALSSSRDSFSSWWLRSRNAVNKQDKHYFQQHFVNNLGIISFHTITSSSSGIECGVRPALWLDITQ